MISTQTHLGYAIGFLELSMVPEAAAELERISPHDQQRLDVMGVRLELHRCAEKWVDMAHVAQHLLAIAPEKVDWWVALAFASRRSTTVAFAQLILLKALLLHPEEPIVHFNLGCYAAQLGKLDEARVYVAKACELDNKFKALAETDEDLAPLRAAG